MQLRLKQLACVSSADESRSCVALFPPPTPIVGGRISPARRTTNTDSTDRTERRTGISQFTHLGLCHWRNFLTSRVSGSVEEPSTAPLAPEGAIRQAAALDSWPTDGMDRLVPRAETGVVYTAPEQSQKRRGNALAELGALQAPCQACATTNSLGSACPYLFRLSRRRRAGWCSSGCDPKLGSGGYGGFRTKTVLCAAACMLGDRQSLGMDGGCCCWPLLGTRAGTLPCFDEYKKLQPFPIWV